MKYAGAARRKHTIHGVKLQYDQMQFRLDLVRFLGNLQGIVQFGQVVRLLWYVENPCDGRLGKISFQQYTANSIGYSNVCFHMRAERIYRWEKRAPSSSNEVHLSVYGSTFLVLHKIEKGDSREEEQKKLLRFLQMLHSFKIICLGMIMVVKVSSCTLNCSDVYFLEHCLLSAKGFSDK